MATLQNTTVPNNGYYRVGNAYISSGGSDKSNFGRDAYYTTSWQGGGGPVLQITTDSSGTLKFYQNPVVNSANIMFSTNTTTTTFFTTTTQINGSLGIGAAHAGSAKVYVYGAGTTIPFLSLNNCKGHNNSNQSLYPTKAGFLAIKIGSSVGPAVGTYYIELWN
jgi:hypothetical protein